MARRSALLVLAAIASLLGLTAFVLALAALVLRPSWSDFVSLGLFLLLSGGLTLLVGWLGALVGPSPLLHSLRSKLLLLIALVAALGVVNVGFTSYLMFISPHDLAVLTLLLLFSFGVSVCLAFFLSLPFSTTIRTFLDAVNRMRAGQLGTRIEITSRDEFEQLADAFNTMAQELEAAFARQRDLEHARQQLIAAVSHDLRNPLASVRAMVESINDGVVTDEQTIRRYMQRLQREVEYLSRLIDDLFELSQINAGLIGLQLDWANLQDVISDTLESVSPQAAQRRLAVEGIIDEALPPVLMDTRRVHRVLLNLVQNALRHTPGDGTIRIEARDLGPEVRVMVSDTGEGIPSEELPRVFEQFYRGDRTRSQDARAGGLGLSIAEGIVEAHGGRIWAESVVGQGSAFFFTLPTRQPVRTPATGSQTLPR
jgi:signal transduction histidine kinase